MPLNSNTGIMTAPVGFGDISRALNLASGDPGIIITRAATINKWAKFKPERHSAIGEMTLAQRKINGFGFDISVGANTSVFQRSAANALDVAIAQNGEWVYLKPRGLAHNERFRPFDFLNPSDHSAMGYAANAPQPYTYVLPSGLVGTGGGSYSGYIPVTREAYAGQCDILDFDIQGGGGPASIGDLYLGVLTRKTNDTTVTLKRSTTKLSQLAYGGTVQLEYLLPSPGDYQGCLVATDATEGGDGTGNFMWLPKSVFSCYFAIQPVTVNYTLEWVGNIAMAMSYDAVNDKYVVRLDMLRAYFSAPGAGVPGTNGQPYELNFAFLTTSNENFWIYTYNPGDTIPNNTGAVTIDLVATPEYIYIDGEDLRKVVSAGDTVKMYLTLNTTGPNGQDVYAVLVYGGTGMAFTTLLTVPNRS